MRVPAHGAAPGGGACSVDGGDITVPGEVDGVDVVRGAMGGGDAMGGGGAMGGGRGIIGGGPAWAYRARSCA